LKTGLDRGQEAQRGCAIKFSHIDLVSGALKRQAEAKSAQASFAEYFKLVARTKSGEPLILDPEIMVTAEAADRAFQSGRSFFDEQGRGSAKSLTGVYFHAWLISKFPSLTVGHFSTNDQYAEDRNEWLADVLRSKEHLEVFGEEGRLLESQSNRRQTTVRGNPRAKSNPNVEAKGILGARAGSRYDRLWIDDVVDLFTSLAHPSMLKSVRDSYRITVQKMLVDWRTLGHGVGRTGVGLLWYSGTPYACDDLHDDLVTRAKMGATKTSGDEFAQVWESDRSVYRRLAFGGNEEGFYSPIPNVISSDFLREAYADGPRAYEMAYMLKPVGAGEKPFSKIFYWVPDTFQSPPSLADDLGYIPAVLPQSEWMAKTRAWPRIMAIDPGFTDKKTSSFTGYVIATLAPDNRIYVLYANQMRHRWDQSQNILIKAAQSWGVDTICIEAAAQQIALVTLFRDKGFPNVKPIPPNNQQKYRRAWDVSGEVNGGRVVLPGTVTTEIVEGKRISRIGPNQNKSYGQVNLLAEHAFACPAVAGSDLLDAFVYAVQELRSRRAPESYASEMKPFGDAMARQRMEAFKEQVFGPEYPDGMIEEASVFADCM